MCEVVHVQTSGGSPVIEFSAKVPDEQYQAFKEAFPQYGAVNWFINTALQNFNKQVEANPAVKELVNRSIEEMLQERRQTA
jgi:hypothetical protein